MKDRIRELLAALNITQHEFAAAVGTDQGSISKYISGKSSPTMAICTSIIYQYSVNPEWFYDGTGPMFLQDLDKKKVALIKKIKNMDEYELEITDYFIECVEKMRNRLNNLNQENKE